MVVQAEKIPMSSKAIKFNPRAPRYTLSPKDNRYLRFAHRQSSGRSHTTRFIDISQSGLAFVCDFENAPRVSDLIKVEIPLETLGQVESVAWWGRVVRVEEYAPMGWSQQPNDTPAHLHQALVAITFHDLPPGHSRAIRRALQEKFAELERDKRTRLVTGMAHFFASNILKFLFYLACTVATFWLLYYLAKPSENYSEKGAPWGERFPNMPFAPGKPK